MPKMMKAINVNSQGKVCPNCGAKGKAWQGEHATCARHCDTGKVNIVDVGWKCYECGHEWGFEFLV
jgi:PHP family Zn ribbon phosphoesterase